ncbi:3'-5' exonuclease [Nocardia macrotermitis]|uniref:DNA 3'-5' helicase n=1 Tax=Nocardia macrotermitis TaxID=2585198 RepID=A0A7K0CX61_9NOCA|nr:3'-5' exonuclease [Nocardia macrotermitis]MQY18090.1 ATP-dependent DNA helicase Rep [Nocardia macrotermitis]
MAFVVNGVNSRSMPKLDGSIKGKIFDFIQKVGLDDTAPGLHIERVKGAADPKVRTGRVDLNFRAILFRIDTRLGDTTYIYLGTWKHDVANKLAEQSVLRVNPVNGVLEAIIGELDGRNDRKKRSVVPDPTGKLAELATQAPAGYLAHVGFSVGDLTEKLGLAPELAQLALAAPDQDAVLAAAQTTDVIWQQNALLELAVGRSIEDIRQTLGFNEQPVDPALDESEQILAALDHPATKMQFVLIDDNDELRRVIEEGDFRAWRTFLHPNQRKYVEKDLPGAFRLTGGAGTGKTVVALHRARELAHRNPDARIVLTTYNKTLALTMLEDLRILDPTLTIAPRPGAPGIYVAGLDKLAAAVFNQASELAPAFEAVFGPDAPVVAGRETGKYRWAGAIRSAATSLDPRLRHASFLEPEYVTVVLGNLVSSLEDYLRVPRAGRGVRLSRTQRAEVWRVIEQYRKHGRTTGKLTFPEILAVAAAHLRLRTESGAGYLADHVIVDEAQDLHATHWRILRSLVAEGPNDLFIAEDAHQRIYGQPVVLSRLGINIRGGRSSRLTLNYRTTAQNLHFAVAILEGTDYRDLEEGEESTAGYTSARLGPNPQLIECRSATEESNVVADRVQHWLDQEHIAPDSIAILTRGRDRRDTLRDALARRGIEVEVLEEEPATPNHVHVLTMHRSKGMEFRCVILASVDQDHVPAHAQLREVPEEEQAEARQRERSLLYVAASRARDQLVVTWSGERSELLR